MNLNKFDELREKIEEKAIQLTEEELAQKSEEQHALNRKFKLLKDEL